MTHQTAGRREKANEPQGERAARGTMTSKQINPSSAPANRHSPAHHPTRRAGEQLQASKLGRADERGQGERKRKTKGHGEHEYLIISSPAIHTSSKHRTTHQPAAPSNEHARRPVAIPSPSRRHHIMGQAVATAISHRSRSRPRRHPFEAVGRRGGRGTVRDNGTAQHLKHGHTNTNAAGNDITRQASAPSAPRPPTRRGGAMKRDDEGRTGERRSE